MTNEMKLDKAIEILTIARTSSEPHRYPDYLDATQLLIEAGKRIVRYRQDMNPQWFEPLPGETAE